MKTQPKDSPGVRVQRKREALGLTQADAALQAGIDRTAWNRIESGARFPTSRQLEPLSRVLKVSVDWILTGRVRK